MGVFEKANELGREIRATPQFQARDACAKALESDEGARAMMERHKLLGRRLADEMASGGADKGIIENLRVELISVKDELSQNEVYVAAAEAESEFAALMEQINRVLRFTVTGDADGEPSACGDCSDCSGCSGCAGKV